MRNLLFFLWLMFFPIMDDLSLYIRKKSGINDVENKCDFLVNTIMMIIYIVVAILLYQPR